MSVTDTSIQWTSSSWSIVRGCSRVSEGCTRCYAERIVARFSKPGMYGHGFAKMTAGGPRWTGKVELVEKELRTPLRWKKPRKIFTSSTSDIFHEALPDDDITRIFAVMALADRHTFQVLSKRAARMREWFWKITPERFSDVAGELVQKLGLPPIHGNLSRSVSWPLKNVWLGVSVEDQATADERLPELTETPAAVRFVSYEPALEHVNFRSYLHRVNMVIIGGESGPRARGFDLAWARSAIEQCRAAGTSAFVKQLGARPYDTDYEGARKRDKVLAVRHGTSLEPEGWTRVVSDRGDEMIRYIRLKDKKGGDPMEWDDDLRVREFPVAG